MSISFWAREDQKNGQNRYVDLTDEDAVEITFVKDGPDGNLVLEDNGGEPDPNTKVVIDGVEYEFVFEMTAELDDGRNVPDEFDDAEVAMITILDYPEPGDETRFMFLPDVDASEDDMNEFGHKKFKLDDVDRHPDDLPVCFVAGTLIDTPFGAKPIEMLQAGDRVMLADGRSKRILMAVHSRFSFGELVRKPALRPVCIEAHSLGGGLPHRDLWVSQQHRIVLRGWQVEMMSGTSEAFAHAGHIAPAPGLPDLSWRHGVTYVHLLLDGHEILIANGAEAESLFLGTQAMQTMAPHARAQVSRLMSERPDLLAQFQGTALPDLKSHEARIWARMVAGEPVFRDLVAQAA
ncbi:Hint domain-containing protein [Shimia sp. Alg240-R146]|uniref:Hint domain-containing protein n=1 Tax=Shimia sp. Alg240-R146 TaxID=2993449 RepID=UPI0022DF41B8|nr:Hint domain-containing protein [Shimia sp. Alg240-R146]